MQPIRRHHRIVRSVCAVRKHCGILWIRIRPGATCPLASPAKIAIHGIYPSRQEEHGSRQCCPRESSGPQDRGRRLKEYSTAHRTVHGEARHDPSRITAMVIRPEFSFNSPRAAVKSRLPRDQDP